MNKVLSVIVLSILLMTISFSNLNVNAFGSAPYGALSVKGINLVGSDGNPVQLKGFSTQGIHFQNGLQWFPDTVNQKSIAFMKNNWSVTAIRAAMYTAEGGYLSNRSVENVVNNIVSAAENAGIYVIIDWHILSDNDPMINVDKAVDFFSRQAKQHGKSPNVLFEICNEPNGSATWEGNIKPYAAKVIPAIRKYSNNVIIVGTSTWSQDIDKAAASPITGANIMYTFHFYAGSHKSLKPRAETISKKIPIFVTEWGTYDVSGNVGFFPKESQEWIDFMEKNNISWCNWSISNKPDISSALKPSASKTGPWTDNDLSESGKLVVKAIKGRRTLTGKSSNVQISPAPATSAAPSPTSAASPSPMPQLSTKSSSEVGRVKPAPTDSSTDKPTNPPSSETGMPPHLTEGQINVIVERLITFWNSFKQMMGIFAQPLEKVY